MPKVYQGQQNTKPYFPLQTYSSLSHYIQQLVFRDRELHVFGTNGTAKNVSKRTKLNVIGISDLYKVLFSPFYTVKMGIYLQAVCRKRILNSNYINRDYLLNRLNQIVQSYYIFAELGLNEIHYDFSDSKKNEVLDVVNCLLKEKSTQSYFNKRDNYNMGEVSRKVTDHSRINKIIFYGIEYMNFSRMSFIHWLKEKGFAVEFRVPFQAEFSSLYQFWDLTYNVITNLTLMDAPHNIEKIKIAGRRFGNFHENKSLSINDRKDINIMEFETPHDFAIYVENHHDTFIAVDSEDVRPIIDFKQSPIYENNVGKFIYNMQFCMLENGILHVTYETLVELITSEWIQTKSAKGSDALSFLIDLEEYMGGTETIMEVKERLARLAELDVVSKTFDRENAEDAGRNRMKRYMLNPFRTFAFLNQERYQVTINQTIELVEHTEKILKHLILEETNTINVNVYFSRWAKFLDQVIEDSDYKQFWNLVFTEEYPEDWEFTIQELLQLIYLGASSNVKVKEKVKSLPAIQEEIMRDNDQTLHITNLTQMNFPESHKAIISVFYSYTDLKECIQSQPNKQPNAIHSLLTDYTVANSFEKLAVFQLYQIIAQYKGPIIFSWINHIKKNSLRNIYLDIMADLYINSRVTVYQPKMSVWDVESAHKETPKWIEEKEIKGKVPNLFWLDHDFCSKKFFLTAFIEQQSVYDSEFHQQFLFSKIGKLFSYSKTERDEFRNLIFPLFPQWTYTKKENLIDMEYKMELRRYKSFENISYPKEMKGLQILRSIYRENRRTKARNQYRQDKKFRDTDLIKQFLGNVDTFHVKAEPGNHCKMCPHLTSCTEGMYAIDNISH